jgi:hypothetical protein
MSKPGVAASLARIAIDAPSNKGDH